MSLLLITNPPSILVVDTDWTTFLTRENAGNIGHGLSIPIFTLTNWDGTTTIPAIAEGSIIEVGGSLYQADADTALVPEGGISDGAVHIKLVPQAGTPPASVVPTLTNDAIPAFDANKGGWYDSDDKFLPFEMTKASAVYTLKSEFIDQNKTFKISAVSEDLTFALTTTPIIIPIGAYTIVNKLVSASDYTIVEMFTGGTWQTIGTGNTTINAASESTFVSSDGVNFRIRMSAGSTTVNYRKM